MEQTTNTKLIEQYLANELSAEQKNAFENALSQDTALQKEVAQQITIHEAAQRANGRVQIKKVAKSYHFYKNIVTLSVIVTIMGVAGILGYFLLKDNLETSYKENRINPTLLTQLANKAPIDNLQSDFFTWNGSDSVIISKNGVLLSIPKDALLLDGKPYNEPAIIQWQEALDAPTIMKSGLSTTSNGKLLETQGMFGLEAYTKDGKKLSVNPNVGIYVQVPVDQYKKGMQLFKGEKDKTGMINWVNPTPLQKIPVPANMKDLNFYPKGYVDTLNKLKLPQGRKYRDSLYASLEEKESNNYNFSNNDYQVKIEEDISGKIFTRVYSLKSKDIAIVTTINKFHEQIINLNNDMSIDYVESNVPVDIIKNNTLSNYNEIKMDIQGKKYSAIGKFPLSKRDLVNMFQNLNTNIVLMAKANSCVFEQEIKLPKSLNNYTLIVGIKKYGFLIYFNLKKNSNNNTIPPSKVLAFWNKKFNNTNLATREFEARMKEIHPTCKAEVLALYVNNLNKSISEIDAQVAKMGYSVFEEFARQNVGAVNPSNPHVKGLLKFYEKTAKTIAEKAQALQAKQTEKENKLDKEMQQERKDETVRTTKREAQALKEEYELNLENVGEQLGKTLGFMIHGGGTVYNIDKYVMDATVSRTSTVITDPETGKTAKITYNDFSFQVKDANKYPKLFAYLFPSKLNSYQRISGTNGSFSYPLNDDIVYHLAILGINDDGFFYYEQKNLNEGKLGGIVLEKLSEMEMDQRIDALNESRGIIKPMKIKDELGWLVKEQKYYRETKRRMDQDRFVRRMKRVVFPCYREEEEGSAGEEIDYPIK